LLSSVTVRQWLSPLVAVLFASIAVTGVLMWLDVRLPGVKQLHEIGGLVFAAAGIAHVVSNWKALTAYFRKPKAWVTLGAGVLACLALLVAGLAGGGDHEDGRERGGRERHERRLG
jgi:hypothetical protein